MNGPFLYKELMLIIHVALPAHIQSGSKSQVLGRPPSGGTVRWAGKDGRERLQMEYGPLDRNVPLS